MKTYLAIGTAVLAAGTMITGANAQVAARRGGAAELRADVIATPYLGIGVKDIDADRAKALNLKDVRGSEITSVSPDSPAAKAGLKDGDVVLEFNGQPVEGQQQLTRMVRETPVGRTVKLGVWRNGSMQTITATVEANKSNTFVFSSNGNGNGAWTMPEMPAMPEMRSFNMPDMNSWQMLIPGSPMLGISGESLSHQDQLAEFFGVKEGVLVKAVTRNSAAEKAGLKAGDVIVKVEDHSVDSTQEITRELRAVHAKKTVNLTVVRNKKEMPITVTIDTPTTGRAVRAGLLELFTQDREI